MTTKTVRDAKCNFENKLANNIKNDTKSFFTYVRATANPKAFQDRYRGKTGKS